jgi:hypothetical protein
MDGAPIVSRCVNAATGALGPLQSGELGMLRGEDYLIQDEALADQDCWRGTVCEADWAGVEQNPDNAGGMTLDTLRARRSSIGANGALSKAASGPRCSKGQLIS